METIVSRFHWCIIELQDTPSSVWIFTMAEQNGVTFDQVSKAATSMLAKGIAPTVRNVISVTGGRTEKVSELLRDYNDKRNAEVLKMANELGSSAIAKLLASEVQSVVDRKTEQLQSMLIELKEQRDEVIDLMSEQEQQTAHRIEIAEAKVIQAINTANEKIVKAEERAEQSDAKTAEYAEIAAQAKLNATESIKASETKSELLIGNAKSEAELLVNAANKRAEKAEQEATSLREQVKLLSIEQAKRDIEQAQYQQTLIAHQNSVAELADERTKNARLQIQFENQTAEISRLTSETQELRADSKQFSLLQGQHIELQKQLTQSQHDLSQSERERESLSVMLRSKE